MEVRATEYLLCQFFNSELRGPLSAASPDEPTCSARRPYVPQVAASRMCREKRSLPERLGQMPVVIGADIAPAGRKLSRHLDGSLNPLLAPQFAASGQVLIGSLPD